MTQSLWARLKVLVCVVVSGASVFLSLSSNGNRPRILQKLATS